MPNGEDDPAFTADEPAIRAERDVAQSELDVGVVVVVVFFFFVDEGEFEDVRALSRSSVWVVCDWPGARADAEEGAVEEELRGRCATRLGGGGGLFVCLRYDEEFERYAEGDAGEADGAERAEVYGGTGDSELTSVV